MKDGMERARKAADQAFHRTLLKEGHIIYTGALGSALDAFLLALREEGMVVVRREPTAAMLEAGGQYFETLDDDYCARETWAAMISASGEETK